MRQNKSLELPNPHIYIINSRTKCMLHSSKMLFHGLKKYLYISMTIIFLSSCSMFSPHLVSYNNDFSKSTPLSIIFNNYEYSYINIYDKKDIYSVNIDKDGIYGINLILNEADNFSGSLIIYNSEKKQITDTESLDSSNFTGKFTVTLNKGNYYIEVNRYSGDAYYRINLYKPSTITYS